MYWLLATAIRVQIEQALLNGAGPTFDQQAAYEARYGEDRGGAPRLLTTRDGVARVEVSGVITQKPSLLAMIFGGGNTTYGDIVEALDAANGDDSVKSIDLVIDSPGGQMDGLFDAVAALQGSKKPVRALVGNLAASAAYALASQAGEIVATSKAARFGSIGVVTTRVLDDKTVDITSTDAPKKRPDASTEEGRAVIREELDGLHELFVDAIATGRKVDPDKVNASYGQGATLLAADALKRGMIDSIAGAELRVVKSSPKANAADEGGNNSETGPMDLQKLRAEHPEAYAAAVAVGVDQERDRVSAFIAAGTASGMMDTAVEAIENGSAMTTKLQTEFLMGTANRNDQQNRNADEQSASGAADGAADGDDGSDAGGDSVAAMVLDGLGLNGENGHA